MKTLRTCIRTLGVGALCLVAVAAQATIITYQEDVSFGGTYQHLGSELRQSSPNNNFGAETLIRTGSGDPLRTVLGFDLTGIPGSQIITNVTLQMHVDSFGGGNSPVVVEIHEATNSVAMTEGVGNSGGGGSLDPNNVSWNNITSGTPWSTPGGDYSPLVLSAVSVTSADGGQFFTFTTSSAFIAAANNAYFNNQPLELVLLAPASENFFGGFIRWDSDDAATASFRPLLTVDYTLIPEPSTVLLLALGGLVMWRRRKQTAE